MDPNISSSATSPNMYDAVMRRYWGKVVEIYNKHPEIHATKITKSDDTALHVVITQGAPESIVLKLVDEIEKTETAMQTMAAKNMRGDTPLHYAASRGSFTVCGRILRVARVDKGKLLSMRNKHKETPLFMAALNGHKRAFLHLHSVCRETGIMSSTSSLWKRENGDTILHCAIQREHFELSLHIMHLYKDENLVNSINEDGKTPLDVLASTPSAFKSGTRLKWWDRHRSNYIHIEELKFDDRPVQSHVVDVDPPVKSNVVDPPVESYKTRGSSLRKIKEKHIWGKQIMEQLLLQNSDYEYYDNESAPYSDLTDDEKERQKKFRTVVAVPKENERGKAQKQQGKSSEKDSQRRKNKRPTALLIATKYGLIELVREILNHIPVAIHDKTTEKRNVVLVAVQKRQSHILMELMNKYPHHWLNLREAVDAKGNNALHLAAKLSKHLPWKIAGSAMQMQWEVKWFEFVKENMPSYLISQPNENGDTPEEIFEAEHEKLVDKSSEWLKDTAGSYSLIATLTATVTFAAAIEVPGGSDDKTGKPIMQGQAIFKTFSIAVLVAFCSSVTALATFLSIHSSRKEQEDFKRNLPLKLVFGLTSFFVSIVSILVSFCAAHSFGLNLGNKLSTSPLYSITLIPICFYAVAQLPLYTLLLKASFTKLPKPRFVGDVPR